MQNTKIYKMPFHKIYDLYIKKVEKKNRTKQEVDQVIFWLTGYNENDLNNIIKNDTNFEDFFENVPKLNPNVDKIKGVICGYRIEEMEDNLMKKIRFLDKLVDEIAKGKNMQKILRK